jgi:hypothetical protein
VLRAGQVGLVKVLSVQNFRDGVRLEIVCGRRALRLLGGVYEQNRQVSQLLSVKPENTKNAVVRLQNQLAEEKFRADRLEDVPPIWPGPGVRRPGGCAAAPARHEQRRVRAPGGRRGQRRAAVWRRSLPARGSSPSTPPSSTTPWSAPTAGTSRRWSRP